MRVLQVYKDYDPPVKGGIEGHINLLANGLIRRGVGVEVLISNTQARDDFLREGKVALTKAAQWGRFASAPLNPGFPRLLKKLSRKADLIHFHFPNPTGEISALATCLPNPLVVTYHSDIVRQKRLKLLYQPLMDRFLRRANGIIVTSPNYLQSSPTLRRFRKKCTVIPLGVDVQRFRAPGADEARDETPQILFVGRFRYYKGLHVLIQAMGEVKHGNLFVVGGGPLEPELRQQVLEHGLSNRIAFLGELSHVELCRRLETCSLLVLPSVERSEAFGIVLLEAMACGKPVISTQLGTGTSYINQHGHTGQVVPPHDPKSLAAAINGLIAHPDSCARMGRAARRRVLSNFTSDQMVDRTRQLYQNLLQQVPEPESDCP